MTALTIGGIVLFVFGVFVLGVRIGYDIGRRQ